MRRIALLLLVAWIASFVAFRQTHIEVWPKDKHAYVIFPAGSFGQSLYYAWRPLSYIDSALTGMRFHIGPHQ